MVYFSKNLLLYFFCSVVFFSLVLCQSNKYCGSDYCDGNKQHTLCKYQVWNNELEISAQRWADQCFGQSTKDTCRDLGEVFVGQNVASIYGESPGLISAALADVWYMELLNINVSIINRYQPSSDSKHLLYDSFTQLVWADSKQVGCGGVKFKEGRDLYGNKNRTVYRLVCNFFPGGNRIGEPVYKDGVACSRCPLGTCDPQYKGLCALFSEQLISKAEAEFLEVESDLDSSTTKMIRLRPLTDPLSKQSNNTEVSKDSMKPLVLNEDDNDSPFLFSYSDEYTRPYLSTMPTASLPCKESFAVDDLVELLKNKLINDSGFKEVFVTKSMINTFSDPSVAAFVNKIYSKVEPTTTEKYIEQDIVNSTLLADLIEAVMFRHGVSDSVQQNTYSYGQLSSNYNAEVSPIKIQAELAEIKTNSGFAGHYFFPEDLGNDFENDSKDQITESYEDTTGFPLSDIMHEIEEMKKKKPTTNFLDEILDSDLENESEIALSSHDFVLNPGSKSNNEGSLLEKAKINKRAFKQNYLSARTKLPFTTQILRKRQKTGFKKTKFIRNYLINYNRLIKRLTNDLNAIKIKDYLHCSYNVSTNRCFNIYMIILPFLNYFKN